MDSQEINLVLLMIGGVVMIYLLGRLTSLVYEVYEQTYTEVLKRVVKKLRRKIRGEEK